MSPSFLRGIVGRREGRGEREKVGAGGRGGYKYDRRRIFYIVQCIVFRPSLIFLLPVK